MKSTQQKYVSFKQVKNLNRYFGINEEKLKNCY